MDEDIDKILNDIDKLPLNTPKQSKRKSSDKYETPKRSKLIKNIVTLSSDEEMDCIVQQSNEANICNIDYEYIDFNKMQTLNFATDRNINAKIWQVAQLGLYQRDSTFGQVGYDQIDKGARYIEIYWNKLNEWLNDAFIFSYLCYIAKKATRKTVVVDTLISDPTLFNTIIDSLQSTGLKRPNRSIESRILNGCFNYDPIINTEVILMPLKFLTAVAGSDSTNGMSKKRQSTAPYAAEL